MDTSFKNAVASMAATDSWSLPIGCLPGARQPHYSSPLGGTTYRRRLDVPNPRRSFLAHLHHSTVMEGKQLVLVVALKIAFFRTCVV